jgi:hypothetical protein
MVDVSAVARVLGVTTQFKNLRRGGILYLPQRIAIFAQGSSDAVYSTTKFSPTSASEVGDRMGYGSPAHLAALEVFPVNGDGVGTIPVTIYPLAEDDDAEPAVGSITPSGTQTTAAAYRVKVNNRASSAFVIPVSATVSARCAAIAAAIAEVLEMPVNVTFTYGTPTATKTTTVGTSNGTCTSLTAPGNPQVGDYILECITAVANGGVWRLTAPDGTVIANNITMTPGVGGATVITQGGLQFTLTDGAEDFDVGDVFTIAVTATTVVLTSKWAGESANDIYVEVEGTDYGTTFAIVQPTGGLVNASLTPALAQVGNVWETLALNTHNIEDTTTLGLLSDFGEGRWGELVRKPLVAFTGNTHTSVAAATAVCSTRRTDRVNAQLVAPGSKDLPFVVAARQLARIAKVANNTPPVGYGAQKATGLTPGADGDQWDFVQRDAAVKLGSSTIESIDGQVSISDVVTFYRPTGDPTPAYRKVVTIIKLQNIIFNLDLIFAAQEWAAAPLIPDDQATVLAEARKPKDAKAAANTMIDNLALQAFISDPKTAKQNTVAGIDGQNPDRLNLEVNVQVSGNTDQKDVKLNFGFFFGAAAA